VGSTVNQFPAVVTSTTPQRKASDKSLKEGQTQTTPRTQEYQEAVLKNAKIIAEEAIKKQVHQSRIKNMSLRKALANMKSENCMLRADKAQLKSAAECNDKMRAQDSKTILSLIQDTEKLAESKK
jgi:putative N-acetylmannosamine-6-phosphate epimerase